MATPKVPTADQIAAEQAAKANIPAIDVPPAPPLEAPAPKAQPPVVTPIAAKAPAPVSTGIRVKATERGHFGGSIRERGDVFTIPDIAALGSWMEPVDFADVEKLKAHMDRLLKFNPRKGDTSMLPPTPAMKLL